METITSLINSPVGFSIGWAILHSLWQGLAVFLVWQLIRPFLIKKKASSIYIIHLLAMGGIAAWSISTFVNRYLTYSAKYLYAAEFSSKGSINLAQYISAQTSGISGLTIEMMMPYLSLLWFTGVLLFSVRLLNGLYEVNSIRTDAKWNVDADFDQLITQLSEKLNISAKVGLKWSERVLVPCVTGFVKPIILLPSSIVSGFTPSQIEAVLLHELAHIRRYDFMVNLVQTLIESFLFFNPFVWYFSFQARKERENACDEMVLANGISPAGYARTLVVVEELRLNSSSLAIQLTGHKNYLINRIKKIMGQNTTSSRSGVAVAALLIAVSTAFISWKRITYEPMEKELVTKLQHKVIDSPSDILSNDASARVSLDTVPKKQTETPAMPTVPAMSSAPTVPPIPNSFQFDESMSFDFNFDDMNFNFDDMNFEFDFGDFDDFNYSFHFGDTTLPILQIHQQKMEEHARELAKRASEMASQQSLMIEQLNQKEMSQLSKEMAEISKKVSEEVRLSMKESKGHLDDAKLQQLLSENEAKIQEMEVKINEMMVPLHKEMEAKMKDFQFDSRELEENMRVFEEKMDKEMEKFEAAFKEMEKEMNSQAVKDGYLKSTDKIDEIKIDDNEIVSINGIKIKDSDKPNYNSIIKKYFGQVSGTLHFDQKEKEKSKAKDKNKNKE